MTLDISKLVHMHDFDFSTTIGTLKSGSTSLATHSALSEHFPDDKVANAAEYIRFLILKVAGRPAETNEKLTPLSEDEVDRLTEDDLNSFAELYIEHNRSWLYRRYSPEDAKGKAGYREIDIPKNEDEDIKTYLQRLIRESIKNHSQEFAATARKLWPKSLFSDAAAELLGRNSSISRVLADQLKSAERLHSALRSTDKLAGAIAAAEKQQHGLEKHLRDLAPTNNFAIESPRKQYEIPILPRLPEFENPIHKTNETLQLVVTHLQSLSAVSSTSAELIRNMNELGLSMASSSAIHAERTAKQNQRMIWVALAGIGIGAIGILVSTGFSVASYFQGAARDNASAVQLEKALSQREALRNALVAGQHATEARQTAAERAFLAAQRATEARQAAMEAELQKLTENRKRTPAHDASVHTTHSKH